MSLWAIAGTVLSKAADVYSSYTAAQAQMANARAARRGAMAPAAAGIVPGMGGLPIGGGSPLSGLLGAVAGTGGFGMKTGRLSGNPIPRGYVEKMSPQGVIYLSRQGKRRGISFRDISSFRRVHRLVRSIAGPGYKARVKSRKR